MTATKSPQEQSQESENEEEKDHLSDGDEVQDILNEVEENEQKQLN